MSKPVTKHQHLKPTYALVAVDWIDIATYGGWGPVKRDDDPRRPIECITVGFLLNESKDHIEVAHSLSEWTCAEVTAIPRVVIRRIRRLK
jgi:hypothetical protein